MLATAALFAAAQAGGCWAAKKAEPGPARVVLELFAVSPEADGEAFRYVRRTADIVRDGRDPDTVAHSLMRGAGDPAILHSTSWRWERDGTIVLTYLAYCEDAAFPGLNPARVRWDELGPPPATDPLHPRPPAIRETDVLAHGLRHFSFLVRYARDGRLAAALSPRSLAFFRAACGQLAGRLEAATKFEECEAVGAR